MKGFRQLRRCLLAPVSLLLGACSGGGSGGNQRLCEYITGGMTTVQSMVGCASCTYSNLPEAIDGNQDSAATIDIGIGGGGVAAIRAIAQDGITYPAGSQAGVVLAYHFNNSTSPVLLVSTYLDGAQQEQFQFGGISGVGGGSKPRSLYLFRTTLAFDATEFSFSRGTSNEAADFQIYEFCSDR